MENWGGNWLVTYLELAKDAKPTELKANHLKQHMVVKDQHGTNCF
jgi:hypothetical protein